VNDQDDLTFFNLLDVIFQAVESASQVIVFEIQLFVKVDGLVGYEEPITHHRKARKEVLILS